MKKILITGAAGFIGAALAARLLSEDKDTYVTGIDSLTDYYDPALKRERLEELKTFGERFRFIKGDIADRLFVEDVMRSVRPDTVVNLAAQAGVRYSLIQPEAYMHSNITGFYNILEACRSYSPVHLVYASSSSVYGTDAKAPFREDAALLTPASLYAATKISNEAMAKAYSHLFGFPSTGLRFFTVYGPKGRPDMAYYKFTIRMIAGERLQIYNNGDMLRDFTYIDDITRGIALVINEGQSEGSEIYNIGAGQPVKLLDFIDVLEDELLEAGVILKRPEREFLPMQPGDVPETWCDTGKLEKRFGYKPETDLRTGLRAFAIWYRERYGTDG
ncbi:MAG: SDR family NAD(P)-dependent oxidoreductase [Lachnospiraceae bacterium]|nr:SDR family NAD(P)-dependent oxidoreductase [Lachnospiraceae bacterium]